MFMITEGKLIRLCLGTIWYTFFMVFMLALLCVLMDAAFNKARRG
jgi:hypothetical protein